MASNSGLILGNRNLLPYINEYFRFTGWTILAPAVSYKEVFRANRLDHKRPIVVFTGLDPDCLFINKRDYRIFQKFVAWLKRTERSKINEMAFL